MKQLLFAFAILLIGCSTTNAQKLSDFNTPKRFSKYSNNEGTYDIPTKVQYNGESFLVFINDKLEVILTDLLFIRDQKTEGVNCKAYHVTCTRDEVRYLVLFAEDAQFFFIKMDGNEFLALTNK